jgi:hypothetical protein
MSAYGHQRHFERLLARCALRLIPTEIWALRGKQVGNKQAVAAVKAHAAQRAANPRAIVDDLRSQGFTSVPTIAAQLNERGILTPRGGA